MYTLHANLDAVSAGVKITIDYPHLHIPRRGGAGFVKSCITRGLYARLYGTVEEKTDF